MNRAPCIESFTVSGFRSFKSEETLKLATNVDGMSGLTIILGKNNSGKTSLLEAMSKRDGQGYDTIRNGDNTAHDPKGFRLTIRDSSGGILRDMRPLRDSKYRLKDSSNVTTDNQQMPEKLFKYLWSRRSWPVRINGSSMSLDDAGNNAFSSMRSRSAEDGNNSLYELASVFRSIEDDDDSYSEFIEVIKRILPDFDRYTSYMDDYERIIYETSDGVEHTASLLGDGVTSVMVIVALLIDSGRKGMAIVIDEPELSLHPDAQRRLSNELFERSMHQQIIIATHSPYFIDSRFLEGGAIVNRINKIGNKSFVNTLGRDKYMEIKSLIKSNRMQPYQFDVVAREIFFQDNILFVEGKDDVGLLRPYFPSYINVYGYGVTGRSNFIPALKLSKFLGVHRAAFLIDGGEHEDDDCKNLDKIRGDYMVAQWNKHDVRDKEFCKIRNGEHTQIKIDGYFDRKFKLKEELELDDFYERVRGIIEYFHDV